ncbi:MAG: cysteine desulfurase [Candidatus Marinimicrobia bacterium]|nr:cysteine desulfurase [Candidatus Neomarinimicrobiota bacterium]MCF7851558.1 cysteine desulfurase [Candidatus Neomarinimicrobiota bacterium]MCF7904678.1 cysteine desulfurase [Candidatus Neomarinimicrobiota bacterium]
MRLKSGEIYLDYNATTPIDPKVRSAMLPFLEEEFGNASSSHLLGTLAHAAMDRARSQVAALLRCSSDEIIFTSGGSESNNLALKGMTERYAHQGRHIIVSAVEHPSIMNVAHWIEKQGFRLSLLPVDKQGVINPTDLNEIITSKTVFVSVMHANNEVGSIQPVSELAEICHDAGAALHVDAAQTVGKIPVQVDEMNCDLLTIAGHKMYGPKGIGALYVKQGTKLSPQILGASQESGLRAGTENIAFIAGLGKAAELAGSGLSHEMSQLESLRDDLQHRMKEAFPLLRINAAATARLPNTLSISFPDLLALDIMEAMDDVLVSAGAACHSGDGKGSGVLEAMGVPLNYQLGTLRISLGRFTTEEQVERAIENIIKAVKKVSNS